MLINKAMIMKRTTPERREGWKKQMMFTYVTICFTALTAYWVKGLSPIDRGTP